MKEGTVKWYSEKKGYGFISTDDNSEFFMHKSAIKDHGFFPLEKSDRVSFETKETNRGVQAVNVRVLK